MSLFAILKGLEGTAEPAVPGDNLDVTETAAAPAAEAEVESKPEQAVPAGDMEHAQTEIVQVAEGYGILPKVAMFSVVVGVAFLYMKRRGARNDIAYKSVA